MQTTDKQLKALGAMTLLEIHAQIELRDNRLIAAYTEIDSLKAVINKLLDENTDLCKQRETLSDLIYAACFSAARDYEAAHAGYGGEDDERNDE